MARCLYLLPLAGLLLGSLACSLTIPSNPTTGRLLSGDLPTATNTLLAIPSPSPVPIQPTTNPSPTPALTLCKVKTGIEDGLLHVRSCGSVQCPALGVVHEGETLILLTPAGDPWLAIQAGDLQGWAYSEYLECKP